MNTHFRLTRHVGALLVMTLGVGAVFWFVLEMNDAPPKAPKAASSDALAMDQVKKAKKTPPKPKPKPKKRRAKRQDALKPAPMPQIGGAVAGVDFGIPGMGQGAFDQAGDMLLDEASRSKDLIMSEGAVDRPPRPVMGNPAPSYPSDAVRNGLSGRVVIKVLIGPDGGVIKARVASASPPGVFDQAALDAVRRWRFEPALYQGQPVKVWAHQPLDFKRS